ncbi:DoxX family membrane protein [Streptomyces sanglieri]|uniref:DoxX family membrane protein n=1 Tax=Streptomyces sanglieri TaxID=193460 RepID=UPI0035268798
MACLDRRDLGLLVLRVGTGAVLAAHGTQKLAGWFGGGGIEGTTAAMEAMGFHPPKHSAVAAGLGEAGGGVLLALGLATPAAGAAAAGAMAGAVAVHAPAGFFAQGGGYEYPAFLGFTAAAIGLTGPGPATCGRSARRPGRRSRTRRRRRPGPRTGHRGPCPAPGCPGCSGGA